MSQLDEPHRPWISSNRTFSAMWSIQSKYGVELLVMATAMRAFFIWEPVSDRRLTARFRAFIEKSWKVIPRKWKKGLFFRFQRREGDESKCDNWRSICMLPIVTPGKIDGEKAGWFQLWMHLQWPTDHLGTTRGVQISGWYKCFLGGVEVHFSEPSTIAFRRGWRTKHH